MKLKYIILLLLLTAGAGCWKAPETIKDVSNLRQDHAAYLPDQTRAMDIIPAETQTRLDEDYNIIFFSVWHQRDPFYAQPKAVGIDLKRFSGNLGYGENKRKHTKTWLKKLEQNASLGNYPNSGYPAITIHNASLRALPTERPHFSSPESDSNGWPFDNLQRSAVAVNTPLFVCHLSADKAWALVETCFTFGWMPVEDFFRVDKKFIARWERGRLAVITRDQTTIFDKDGNFGVKSSLGYIFPIVEETPQKFEILFAVGNKKGDSAVIRRGYVTRQAAVAKPLRFTSLNAIRIANELVGEPYGWGGLYGNRDCSSTTRDFFAVFGIWLPRHSEDQVKEAGVFTNLAGLSSEKKEAVIIARGIPYLTLLWRKGHVMLYIGEQNGQALIFHNIWGIRTKDLRGREGRKIIGEAVITTLHPGRELQNFDIDAGDLLSNISGMSILTP
jgi:cell wall-associated NlpC family hydrolase